MLPGNQSSAYQRTFARSDGDITIVMKRHANAPGKTWWRLETVPNEPAHTATITWPSADDIQRAAADNLSRWAEIEEQTTSHTYSARFALPSGIQQLERLAFFRQLIEATAVQ